MTDDPRPDDAHPTPDADRTPDVGPTPDAPVAADAGGDTGAAGGDPGGAGEQPARPAVRWWQPGRYDRKAAVSIGVLTLLLGFAFAVQVRTTGTEDDLSGLREEDLVSILDEVTGQEDRLRQEIAEQRTELEQLGGDDGQAATALENARERADALDVLNGSVAATGPGLQLTISDPEGRVEAATVLDAVQELRGAGAETMQVDDVRVGVSTAVTGAPGALEVDGKPITAPYTFVVIGSPQDLETAMSIPGGVVSKVGQKGGTVSIAQSDQVVVDALRPLDEPEYARPSTAD